MTTATCGTNQATMEMVMLTLHAIPPLRKDGLRSQRNRRKKKNSLKDMELPIIICIIKIKKEITDIDMNDC